MEYNLETPTQMINELERHIGVYGNVGLSPSSALLHLDCHKYAATPDERI